MKWEIAKLGKIAIIRTGKLDSNAAVIGGRYPFFTCDPNTLSIDVWAYDTEAVLLAGNNASGNYTAKYYKGKFNAYQRTYIIESANEEELNIRYLYYALNQQLRLLKTMSSGSTTKFLTIRMLDNLDIPLIGINIQTQIVNILSAYDDLIENNQKQIKLLEEAAQRLYKEWFVDLNFPGHENTEIVDGVPEGWIKEEIGKIIKKVHRTKQIVASEYKDEGSIPIVDQSRAFVAGYTNDLEARVDFGIPIIVFGDHTRIVKLIQFPFAKGADGTQLIISDCLEMPQRLLYCSIMNVDLSNYHYARHFKYLKEEKIMIPTVKVANGFENNVTGIFSKIQNCRDEIIRCQKTSDLLLPKLMSGEVEV